MGGNRKSGAARESDKKPGQIIDGETGILAPTPRRIDLSSLRDVRLELAHVYRSLDAGRIESHEATRRAYVLKMIHDVLVSAELERRIDELEAKAFEGGTLTAARALSQSH